jgi:hypothetical protein
MPLGLLQWVTQDAIDGADGHVELGDDHALFHGDLCVARWCHAVVPPVPSSVHLSAVVCAYPAST